VDTFFSPCLSKVSHDVENRKKDLLNPNQRSVQILNFYLSAGGKGGGSIKDCLK
jgi:hypothetical protein